MLPMTTLVIGGGASGKSAFAEGLVEASPAPHLYLATAEAWDDEMASKIARHVSRRGVVPADAETRAFREAHGRMNIALAAQADLAIQVVAGLPVVLKGATP